MRRRSGYREAVSFIRRCSRSGCTRQANTTLTYVYADSTAVMGPLAAYPEPHSYDLCEAHSERLTVPRGWEVVRMLRTGETPPPRDDLVAIAEAVTESERRVDVEARQGLPRQRRTPEAGDEAGMVEVSRRGHLRVLRSTEDAAPTPG